MRRPAEDPLDVAPLTDPLAAWVAHYRAEAKSDDFKRVRDALEAQDEPSGADDARDFVEETIRRVVLTHSVRRFESSGEPSDFLSMQTYDPSRSSARYRITFDPGGGSILFAHLSDFDLADQYVVPPGFLSVVIDHVDGSDFSQDEHVALVKAIEEDIFYDFEREEMTLEFNDQPWGVQVLFHEHEDDDDEDESE